MGLALLRGRHVVEPSEVIRLMDDHVPTWLPSGFGLTGAWTDTRQTWVLWSDRRCRSVTVTFTHDRGGTGAWTVDYDKPHACGNQVVGMVECISYSVSATGGHVNVQTIGLARSDADLLIRSIKV